MSDENRGNDHAIELALGIARSTLAGEVDPLIACREIASMRSRLWGVPDGVMDVFIGVASEVDDLPLGIERDYWSQDSLRDRDVEASDYRSRVEDVVLSAMRYFVSFFESV